MAETMKVHPDCPNASNPYHECGQYCTSKIAEATGRKGKKSSGPNLLNAPRSFDRRIKESKTQPKPRQVPHSVSAPMEYAADTPPSPQSKKTVEPRNVEPPLLFQPYSNEIHDEDAIMPASPDNNPKDNLNPTKNMTNPVKPEQNGKLQAPLEVVSSPDSEAAQGNKAAANRSLSFNFSGITQDFVDSDEEEALSVISDYDSRVWIGKYHVKASISSILQAIFEKHGDIAANCQLESLALRAYYLECVCFVVQELQSSPIMHLTKSKLREMLAILKDVESAQVNVTWLRRVVNEIIELIEPITQQRAIEAAKASTRRELETQMEDLAKKEKELKAAKAKIAETKARLSQIESEASEFSKNLASIRSKVENFDMKALLDQIV